MAERDQDEEDNAGGPPRGALIGLVVIVVLVIGVVFIMQRLHQADSLQDCVASARTNCAPIDPQHR